MFEAAAIVGLKLFDEDRAAISALAARTDERIAVLPKHVYPARNAIDDDF